MATPAIQTLLTDAQQVLNLNSLSEVRATMAAALANANVGTPLNPNLTTQQLWDEFYLIVRQPESDIESIITNQLMKFLFAPPAPGGVGADGQVIFNDGGVLAGDPQFLWNKTTNLLTVTGSATITGDLTVRTTGLTTTASAVGINTASPTANTLTIGASRYILCSDSQSKFGDNGIINGAAADANTQIQYFGGKALFFNEGVATRMTLNSTGLGVGVTPSAWASTWKAIQVGAIGSLSYSPDDTGYTISTSNGYWNGSNWIRIAAAAVSAYSQNQGKHSWLSAASSSAGSTIAFGDAKMTLDASGNLILLSSNTPATLTTNGQLTVNATSDTNLRFSYRGSDGVTRTANLTLAP